MVMRKIVYIAVLLVIIAALIMPTTCTGEGRKNTVSMTGEIRFIELEGGFYGIAGDDGKNYDPLNLSREFQQDGLRILFDAKIRTDVATIRQWGTVVEITRIESLAGR